MCEIWNIMSNTTHLQLCHLERINWRNRHSHESWFIMAPYGKKPPPNLGVAWRGSPSTFRCPRYINTARSQRSSFLKAFKVWRNCSSILMSWFEMRPGNFSKTNLIFFVGVPFFKGRIPIPLWCFDHLGWRDCVCRQVCHFSTSIGNKRWKDQLWLLNGSTIWL